MSEVQYQIALNLSPGIGTQMARNIIAYSGSAEEAFKASKAKLLKIPGIGNHRALGLLSEAKDELLARAEAEIYFCEKHGIKILTHNDEGYPQRLKQNDDAPLVLFFKGNVDLNNAKFVAIVGTRKSTEYGNRITEQIVADFVGLNVIVISGLAYGIDVAAHKAALQKNLATVGVLGHGMHTIYPSLHKSIATKMIENGGLLTEFVNGTLPNRENFPKRNRIVAGLCDALIVVEAAAEGGALITADLANGYSRDVYAVPGRTGDIFSEGCNNLIKANKAALITSGNDVIHMMGWNHASKKASVPQYTLFHELNDSEKLICEAIRSNPGIEIDLLTATTRLSQSDIATQLLSLELSGLVKTMPGKKYHLM
jgi:DNA processing protein